MRGFIRRKLARANARGRSDQFSTEKSEIMNDFRKTGPNHNPYTVRSPFEIALKAALLEIAEEKDS